MAPINTVPSTLVLVRRWEPGRRRRRRVVIAVELDGDGLEHAPEPVRTARVRVGDDHPTRLAVRLYVSS